jgi:uncharacterized delta-60 repeat protein
VALTPKAVETLTVLIQRPGRLVERDELMNSVWRDVAVEDGNLTVTISMLRKALGENDNGRKFIETVPRLGYKFIADVREVVEEVPALVVEKQTLARVVIDEEFRLGAKSFSESVSRLLSIPRWLKPLAAIAGVVVLLAGASAYFLRSKSTPTNAGQAPAAMIGTDRSGFARDGTVLTDFGFKVEKALAVALQPDGKIVAGGWVGDSEVTSDFAIARYNADGTLDPSFHGDGKVVTALGERTDIIYGLAVQPDGKILAVGVTFSGPKTRRFAIVRYKSDGALDASFDGDGIVALNIGTSLMDTAYAVAVQPDGKILVAGSALMLVVGSNSRVNQNDFGLVRLNTDGSLDTTFGANGRVITDFGYGVDVAYALAVQPDGRIVVAGVATNGTDQDFALARYQSDGMPDASFGKDGKVRTDFFEEDDLISTLAIQPDGKIIVAGYSAKAKAFDLALARYSDDGSLDNSFNGNGKLTMDINGNDIGRGVAIQPDGKIVVAVYANHGAASEFAFARLFADGRLDESFYAVGKARIPFQKPAESFGIALLSDRYAVSAGSAGDRNSSDFALTRIRL